MCWKTYVLSRSKVEVIAPFTMDMHRKKVSASLSVATEACTQKMRKGLEYVHSENHRIKEKRVPNVRSK